MKKRKIILMESKENPFIVTFTELEDYENLRYSFSTIGEALDKINGLIDEARKNKQPYYAEITQRIIVDSEE